MLVGLAFIIGGSVGNTAKGTSASGTSIPISKGGTGATTAQGALQSLLPDFADNNGRVLGSNGTSIGWVDGGKDSYMTPDYANMEPQNLITENNGEWIVDRLGFVKVSIQVDTSGISYVNIYVNDVVALGSASGSPEVPAFWSGDAITGVLAVKVGDKIKIVGEETTSDKYKNIGCYFIPPIYSTPPDQNIVAEVGGDYSLDEKPVYVNDNGTVRQKKDVNGDPLFVRTFKGNIVAAANAFVSTDIATGIKACTDFKGWWQVGGTNATKYAIGNLADGTKYVFQIGISTVGSLVISSKSDLVREGTTNNAYEITVEYTKAD
jgi:hypothetical protein